MTRGAFTRARRLMALAVPLGLLFAFVPAQAQAAAAQVGSTGGVILGRADASPQSAAWLATKNARLIRLDPTTRQAIVLTAGSASAMSAQTAATYSSYRLDYSHTQYFLEPEGGTTSSGPYGQDDAGNWISDRNYWNFCMAGAASVAMLYEGAAPPSPPLFTSGWYREPDYSIYHQTTFWQASSTDYRFGYQTYGRAYIMYMAEAVQPQSPQSSNFNSKVKGVVQNTPGMMDFSTAYPTTGSTLATARDAMNWESSAHNVRGAWPGYFWAVVSTSSVTTSNLHADIVWDITQSGVPIVAAVNTAYLGNWGSGHSVAHAIAIIGYNDTAGTYDYVDTCAAHCSYGSFNGGVHTITQTNLYNAIKSLSLGGFVW